MITGGNRGRVEAGKEGTGTTKSLKMMEDVRVTVSERGTESGTDEGTDGG